MSDDEDSAGADIASLASIGVVCFERNESTGRRIVDALATEFQTVDYRSYHEGAFEAAFDEFDAVVGVMAVGIVVRKIAPLLGSKWEDPAVVAVDSHLTWAIPLVGGHHGANALARTLASLGAVPAVTTASEVSGERSVEARADALDSAIETPDSTVQTNLAVLDDELGPVARLDGPRAVLVSDDVTVMKRTQPDGIVLGTGCVSDVEADQVLEAWDRALDAVGRDIEDVEFVATGRLKADETGLFEAAAERDLGVVLFERETLEDFEGPTESKASALLDWPGIAEASAIAGGRNHELILEKQRFEGAVTVAVGR